LDSIDNNNFQISAPQRSLYSARKWWRTW